MLGYFSHHHGLFQKQAFNFEIHRAKTAAESSCRTTDSEHHLARSIFNVERRCAEGEFLFDYGCEIAQRGLYVHLLSTTVAVGVQSNVGVSFRPIDFDGKGSTCSQTAAKYKIRD